MRCSIALRILASSVEKSYASSTAVGFVVPSTDEEESVRPWERFALPAFLKDVDVTEKLRIDLRQTYSGRWLRRHGEREDRCSCALLSRCQTTTCIKAF